LSAEEHKFPEMTHFFFLKCSLNEQASTHWSFLLFSHTTVVTLRKMSNFPEDDVMPTYIALQFRRDDLSRISTLGLGLCL